MLKQIRKQSGFTIIELLIVIAIIGILATLVLTNFQGAQARGRDTVRRSDINSLYQKLEEYYNENNGYPDGSLSAATFPGVDEGALTDEDGATITTNINTGAAPGSITIPGNTNEYVYNGYNCAATPTGSSCTEYTLATFLEQDAAGYTKVSLN